MTTFTLYLPTAVATLLTAWIIAVADGRAFGVRAGMFGGLAFLLSNFGAEQMATARWDGLFALTVTIAALAAFRAWMRGDGWTTFWLAATIATLTKGSVGVLLAGLGLAAVAWEHLAGRRKPLRGSHVTGIGLRTAVAAYPRMATRVGPLVVTLSGVRLGPAWDNVIDLRSSRRAGDTVIDNVSGESQEVQVRIDGRPRASRRLAAGESWTLAVP